MTITEGPDGDRFHADIAEVVHTHPNDQATMLVVEWWTPAHGLAGYLGQRGPEIRFLR